jgi:hypothetical protein
VNRANINRLYDPMTDVEPRHLVDEVTDLNHAIPFIRHHHDIPQLDRKDPLWPRVLSSQAVHHPHPTFGRMPSSSNHDNNDRTSPKTTKKKVASRRKISSESIAQRPMDIRSKLKDSSREYGNHIGFMQYRQYYDGAPTTNMNTSDRSLQASSSPSVGCIYNDTQLRTTIRNAPDYTATRIDLCSSYMSIKAEKQAQFKNRLGILI